MSWEDCEKPPRFSAKTLREMYCGMMAVSGGEFVFSPLDRAQEWLWRIVPTAKPTAHVAYDVTLDKFVVKTRIDASSGERMEFVEDATDFPSEFLLTQIMLVKR